MNAQQQQHPSITMPASGDDGGANSRGSAGSAAARAVGGSRSRQNPQHQLSTIEKSVTHLLVATKQLLETLTMWSTGLATEGEVSDVYVRLGYEFNIACRAFNAIGVETTDLGPVPDMLRSILEETLSQDASQQSLEKYLPKIRDIIINLLHGLKKKQQRLRQKSGRDSGGAGESSRLPRQASLASSTSTAASLTEQLEDLPSRHSSSKSYTQRQGSRELTGPDLPARTTSAPTGRNSPRKHDLTSQDSVAFHDTARDSDTNSSISTNTMQSMPVITPYPEAGMMPTNRAYENKEPESRSPQPRPKANDALTALQRGGELERRASRRFSAYQIQKHLGTSINGIQAIPPAQHSPIPNRGRDVRESLNAVRSRGGALHNRARPRKGFEPSPNRDYDDRRISEASHEEDLAQPEKPTPSPDQDSGVPPVNTIHENRASPFSPQTNESIGATLNGPIDEPFTLEDKLAEPDGSPTIKPSRGKSVRHPREHTSPVESLQSGKELTLFLQYKSKIKKFVLPDDGELTTARLQLAFIEKFAWNTQNNGADLPEIYVQDPISGVRHELEDLNDVKDRSVLVLNVEALDEVKRHFDDGIGSLRRLVEGIRTSVDDQKSALQAVSDRQQETVKELASLAAAGSTTVLHTPLSASTSLFNTDTRGQVKEVQTLKRDLAVLRQAYNSFMSDTKASMATLRTKAAAVKKAAADAEIPVMNNSTGRSYVNKGKKSLSEDSERIVNKVDDLQDIVEDLRKDVVSRGVRPLARQLENVSKDISTATADLKKLQEFLKREKPIWTKIWEKELQVVCDDRDLLTMQEDLATDLEDDLEKAAQTFALVEEATRQQSMQNPKGSQGTRSASRTLKPISDDPQRAKDSVLGEVRALQPNHEDRLEAIERAEKARQRELETRRGGEFQRELGNFVEEGKLKKSGGVEEVERMRLSREEKTRKEVFERQQQRERERAEKAAAAAVAAAAEQQQQPNGAFEQYANPDVGQTGFEGSEQPDNNSESAESGLVNAASASPTEKSP